MCRTNRVSGCLEEEGMQGVTYFVQDFIEKVIVSMKDEVSVQFRKYILKVSSVQKAMVR